MSAADALSFDPDALRQRYREERDLRLRPDGNEQYLQIAGDLASYGVDPYLTEVIERGPLTEEVEVVIIGGGFGGLIAAARLKQQGIEDVRIVEKGGDFGGTWYWNRYPGAQCDTASMIYLPLLEEGDIAEMIANDPLVADSVELMKRVIPPPSMTADIWTSVEPFWGIFDLVESEGMTVEGAVNQATEECQEVTDQLFETFDSIGQ